MNVPDFAGVFANRTIRAEFCAAGDIHQALSAKRDAVAIIAVDVFASLAERQKLMQHEIIVRR